MLEEQQLVIQKIKGDYEDDKINWNKQHQEHVLSVEVRINNKNKLKKFYINCLKKHPQVSF